MASMNLAFIELFWELMNRKTGTLGRVEYKPQKPVFKTGVPSLYPLERSVPEQEGVSSSYIASLISDLASAPNTHLHQIMIARHGKVIYEGAFDPYLPGVWHATYSMCKSFTGMAIGLLVSDGVLSLDTPVLELFRTHASLQGVIQKIRYNGLTVYDLLTMSSGVSFNEMGAITGNDWVKLFLESSAKFEPGTRFEYNSMNSFVLSAIVTQLTGKTMLDFLQERLFNPMGITNVFWERSPRGITKGGWGMFLRPEDAVKLGMLYLQKGRWNGVQLLPEDWVEDSVSPQIKTGLDYAPYYGYHCWIGHLPGSFVFNGMLGQNVYVYPTLDMVICVNSGNTELFSNGNMTAIFHRYFSDSYMPSPVPLPKNTGAYRHLMEIRRICGPVTRLEDLTESIPAEDDPMDDSTDEAVRPSADSSRDLSTGTSYAGSGVAKAFASGKAGNFSQPIRRGGWSQQRRGRNSVEAVPAASLLRILSGRVYVMSSGNIGLFPLLVQIVHNNYTRGISMLRFRMEDGVFYVDFREGDSLHRIPVGFGKGRHTRIKENGEEYIVGTVGRIALNEDDIPVLTLRIALLEEASERQLKIFFLSDEEIELHWSETPGSTVIGDGFQIVASGKGGTNRIFTGMLSQVSPDLISEIMQSLVKPMVKAVWTKDADIECIGEEKSTDSTSSGQADGGLDGPATNMDKGQTGNSRTDAEQPESSVAEAEQQEISAVDEEQQEKSPAETELVISGAVEATPEGDEAGKEQESPGADGYWLDD